MTKDDLEHLRDVLHTLHLDIKERISVIEFTHDEEMMIGVCKKNKKTI